VIADRSNAPAASSQDSRGAEISMPDGEVRIVSENLLPSLQSYLLTRETKRAHLPKVQQQNGNSGEAVCETLYWNYMPPPLVYGVTHSTRHSNNCQLETLSKTPFE
jgi:hypothetical protein